MKKVLFSFVFLFAQIAFSHPNIICFSYGQPEAMYTEVLMGIGRVGDRAVITNVGLGSQQTGGGNALCTRTMRELDSASNLVDVAHFYVYEDGLGPLADTCEFEPGIQFDIIARESVIVQRGEHIELSMAIDMGFLKIINYVPTAREITLWESKPQQTAWLAQKKCLELVPNSEFLPSPLMNQMKTFRVNVF
ncbi:MAG: hypothetical protein V4692_12250 [Bdellovibrionota bacterium]